MFIDKIRKKKSGVLVYGITPPKAITPSERVGEIAAKSVASLSTLDIDALIVYDVQDESVRTAEERPFPFSDSLDPFLYASKFLSSLDVPKIIYRPASKFTKEELATWLAGMAQHDFYPVFVGLPTPDYIPKTSLKEAYAIWKNYEDRSVIGAVTIPERHVLLKDEEVRMLDKVDAGVSFFVSQCIFNVAITEQMLHDLKKACNSQHRELPTVIFTLTVCGSAKTLLFMEWLGIHIPEDIKEELKTSTNPLSRSVEMAIRTATELTHYCIANNIPFGFNIESVAIRKEEIEASVNLINTVSGMLKKEGLR